MSDPNGKKIRMLEDPAGDVSSKRAESFAALLYAIVFSVLAGALGWKDRVPVSEITIAFLSYSAIMQGVAYFNDKPLLK